MTTITSQRQGYTASPDTRAAGMCLVLGGGVAGSAATAAVGIPAAWAAMYAIAWERAQAQVRAQAVLERAWESVREVAESN